MEPDYFDGISSEHADIANKSIKANKRWQPRDYRALEAHTCDNTAQ